MGKQKREIQKNRRGVPHTEVGQEGENVRKDPREKLKGEPGQKTHNSMSPGWVVDAGIVRPQKKKT